MFGEGPPWLEQFPVRRGWGMGCLTLGQRWLQGGRRRVAQFPHSNGATMLILPLCDPFVIKPHTKGCVICQNLILNSPREKGPLYVDGKTGYFTSPWQGEEYFLGSNRSHSSLPGSPAFEAAPWWKTYIYITFYRRMVKVLLPHIPCWWPRENSHWKMPVFF